MKYELLQGDCLSVMATMPANSIDSIVSDPPYGLSFMSKNWDHGVPGVPFWEQALRVAKPGAFLFAFGGTRTQHRLMVAIEDAGWEMRDVIMWVYGSGFPKSADISKLIDKASGVESIPTGEYKRASIQRNGSGENWNRGAFGSHPEETKRVAITVPATEAARLFDGYGTALKPAWEPIIVAMKPVDGTYANNAITWGVAGLNIDECRVPITDGAIMARNNKPGENGWKNSSGGANSAALHGEPNGRWPANFIWDGSDEVKDLFPITTSGGGNKSRKGTTELSAVYGTYGSPPPDVREVDTGNASRFFYCAKASSSERSAGIGSEAQQRDEGRNVDQPSMNGGDGNPYNRGAKPVVNHHPTVKPIELMRYLCRLVKTPTGGTILDPFMGSGSTGVAALLEGAIFVGIEKESDYIEIARQRLAHYEDERSMDPMKLTGKPSDYADMPLFAT